MIYEKEMAAKNLIDVSEITWPLHTSIETSFPHVLSRNPVTLLAQRKTSGFPPTASGNDDGVFRGQKFLHAPINTKQKLQRH